MRELQGDMWAANADAFVVPINRSIRTDGRLVMGAGVALQAQTRYPFLAREWGEAVAQQTVPATLITPLVAGLYIVGLPTKHAWDDRMADIDLIVHGAQTLANAADEFDWEHIALPRIGAGLGRQRWDFVRACIGSILDTRFVVYTP